MRNLLTRAVFDKTFKAGEKFAEPDLSTSEASFLYSDSAGFHFMDQENFETLTLSTDVVGDDREFLTDNLVVQINKLEGRPFGIQLPTIVELAVASTEPAVRGDTASGGGHQGGHARDRPRDPRAALHQGRREGEGPHRDPRVRRPRVASWPAGWPDSLEGGLQTAQRTWPRVFRPAVLALRPQRGHRRTACRLGCRTARRTRSACGCR